MSSGIRGVRSEGPTGKFRLDFRELYLYTGDVLFHVKCCIRQRCSPSIIACNITSIAHNHHTDNDSQTYIFILILMQPSLEMLVAASSMVKGELALTSEAGGQLFHWGEKVDLKFWGEENKAETASVVAPTPVADSEDNDNDTEAAAAAEGGDDAPEDELPEEGEYSDAVEVSNELNTRQRLQFLAEKHLSEADLATFNQQ